MHHLATGDWIVILAYLAGIIVFGIWCGRGQRNARDYFLGNRSVSWWGVGLSIVATETSALTFIGVPALAYGQDLTFLQMTFGYVLARVVIAAVMVPHYFRGDVYSPYQLVSDAFGPSARTVVSIMFLIAGTLAAGVRVYVTCIPLDLMMGDRLTAWFGDPMMGAILLFVGLSLIYTWAGGIKAVIWTDAVQFILLAGGGLFALGYLPTVIDGGWEAAMREAAAGGKLRWWNGSFGLAMPFNIWMGLIGGTVLGMSTHGADQLIVQRVLACRSVKDGRRALLLSAFIIVPLFLTFLVVGVLLWVHYAQRAPAIALPETRSGFAKNDYIFPVFILTEIPPVLKGALVVAILSAAMSSVSSALSALASVSTMDLWRAWRPTPLTAAAELAWSRGATLFWAVLLIGVAWWSRGADSVLNWALSLSGLTSGAMLGGVLMALWWKRRSPGSVIAGMVASLFCMTLLSRWEWTAGGTVNAPEPLKLAWPWFTLSGTMITLAVAWAADWLRTRGSRG